MLLESFRPLPRAVGPPLEEPNRHRLLQVFPCLTVALISFWLLNISGVGPLIFEPSGRGRGRGRGRGARGSGSGSGRGSGRGRSVRIDDDDGEAKSGHGRGAPRGRGRGRGRAPGAKGWDDRRNKRTRNYFF